MISMQAKKTKGEGSPYLPARAVVTNSRALTLRDTLLTIRTDRPLDYQPGQFLMAGLPGFGEAAISISSPPAKGRTIELCIRNAGSLTSKLCALEKGDTIWLRGPAGRGFEMPPKGEDLLFIIGGMGLVPARSLIKAVLNKKKAYGKMTILYGIKTSQDLLFSKEIEQWRTQGVEVFITADARDKDWHGHKGVVTTLIPPLRVERLKTSAYAIGPPAMYRYVVVPLAKKGIRQEKTFLSLERRMRCALGRCGHCLIGGVYVCRCGPVFSLAEVAEMPGAI